MVAEEEAGSALEVVIGLALEGVGSMLLSIGLVPVPQEASMNGTANMHKRLKVVFILIPFFLQKDRHNLPPTFKGLILKLTIL